MLQKLCLRISANESYQNAEIEIEAQTGIKVGHSTQQKLVLEHEFQLPLAKQKISEVSVDGGKVRLRGQPKEGFDWKDYKAIRLQGIYYAAFFGDNQSLIDYVNSQPLVNPLVCLGDGETLGGVGFRPAKVLNPKGHDGVWNIAREFGTSDFQRLEILDWYHLKENLYKVGGSLKRLKASEVAGQSTLSRHIRAKTLLWQGSADEAKTLFMGLKGKQAKNFIAYIDKHKSRIVNYTYYQAEGISSIGSGAVESAIKQIGRRIKISGAKWNIGSVNQILGVRCAYLNGLLNI